MPHAITDPSPVVHLAQGVLLLWGVSLLVLNSTVDAFDDMLTREVPCHTHHRATDTQTYHAHLTYRDRIRSSARCYLASARSGLNCGGTGA